MNNTETLSKTGGQFLLSPISNANVYSREDFSDEHTEIYNMVMEFDRDRVLAQKEAIEKYDPELSKSLIKETGEIGEHTSELQSHHDLGCRLLLEKKNTTTIKYITPETKNAIC